MMRFHRMRSKWEVLQKTPIDTALYVSSRSFLIPKYISWTFRRCCFLLLHDCYCRWFSCLWLNIRNFEPLVVLKWPDLGLKYVLPSSNLSYTESASGQDETNPAFWLATPACKDFSLWSLKKKFSFWPYNKFFIDQAYSVKMAGFWHRSVLRFLLKSRNLANIQSSWHHSWSMTHIQCFTTVQLTLLLGILGYPVPIGFLSYFCSSIFQ